MGTNKLNKLFLILGIGIGLLVSSMLNIAYPNIKYMPYSESQIIEKAKELGMVFLKEAISKNDEKSAEIDTTDVEDEVDNIEESTVPQNEDKHEVEFVINKGDNSERIAEKLLEAGIIKNKEEFIKEIIAKNAQKKFQYGIYELETEMDYESLIKILTNK